MTLEPSVVFWTILNFAVLALVLERFLFRPLLRFMDERKARTEAGIAAGREAQAELDAEQARLREEAAALSASQQQLTEQAAAQAQEERTLLLAQAEAESNAAYDAALEQLRRDETALSAELDAALPILSAALVRKLTERGD